MYQILDAKKKGNCPFCRGKRDKPMFVVKGPYTGEVCSVHLHILASQQPKEDEAPLFNNDRVKV